MKLSNKTIGFTIAALVMCLVGSISIATGSFLPIGISSLVACIICVALPND